MPARVVRAWLAGATRASGTRYPIPVCGNGRRGLGPTVRGILTRSQSRRARLASQRPRLCRRRPDTAIVARIRRKTRRRGEARRNGAVRGTGKGTSWQWWWYHSSVTSPLCHNQTVGILRVRARALVTRYSISHGRHANSISSPRGAHRCSPARVRVPSRRVLFKLILVKLEAIVRRIPLRPTTIRGM
jgi:hypothetical protein